MSPSAGLMLVQRRRRLANIKPALGRGAMFSGVGDDVFISLVGSGPWFITCDSMYLLTGITYPSRSRHESDGVYCWASQRRRRWANSNPTLESVVACSQSSQPLSAAIFY